MDRRRKDWRDLSGLARELNAGSAQDDGTEEVDGFVFDYNLEPRCLVCGASDPDRALPNGETVRTTVDEAIVNGWPYAEILRRITPLMQDWPPERKVSYHSIRRHQLRHLGADRAAVRALIERRAEEQSLRIVEGSGSLVTTMALLELVRQRGFERVVAGELEPSLRESIDAARMIDDLEADAQTLGTERRLLEQRLRAFVEIVRREVPEEVWRSILDRFAGRDGEVSPAPGLPPAEDHLAGGEDDAA